MHACDGLEKNDKKLDPHWIADHTSLMLGYTDGISNTVSLVMDSWSYIINVTLYGLNKQHSNIG